ncbi:hypothetical protein LZ30DRAFT_703039 [Colletotrichum cereale]|nr:hypothetical protein LZ30DRAFT_703039 [Colletotrichum cereale]
MGWSSYNLSNVSESSTDSLFGKEASSRLSKPLRKSRSLRKRLKSLFRNIGHPPTYRYDLEHGTKPLAAVQAGITGPSILNKPSYM